MFKSISKILPNALVFPLLLFINVASHPVTEPYMVEDINPNEGSTPRHLTLIDGRLFFLTHEESCGEGGLYLSEGYATNTIRLHKYKIFGTCSDAADLTAVEDTLYFQNCESSTGCELWKSDGSSSGTKMGKKY
jgi:hypothetical protein